MSSAGDGPDAEPPAGAPPYDPARYWGERLGRDFSLAGAGHAGVGLAFNRWAYRVRRQVLRRVLAEQGVAVSGARVLELGFGTGFYLDLWRELGATHVLGIDIAEPAVRAARERHGAGGWRFEQADIGQPLPLGDAAVVGSPLPVGEGKVRDGTAAAYDIATAFDVLFHLVDDAAWNGALDNVAAALRPGGHALLFDKFQRTESAVRHVKRRTGDAYREALAARGLEIRAVRPIFFFMNSPTDLRGCARLAWKGLWSLVKLPYKVGRKVGLGDAFGGAMGAALYLPELALGRVCATGPSTKLLVARKAER